MRRYAMAMVVGLGACGGGGTHEIVVAGGEDMSPAIAFDGGVSPDLGPTDVVNMPSQPGMIPSPPDMMPFQPESYTLDGYTIITKPAFGTCGGLDQEGVPQLACANNTCNSGFHFTGIDCQPDTDCGALFQVACTNTIDPSTGYNGGCIAGNLFLVDVNSRTAPSRAIKNNANTLRCIPYYWANFDCPLNTGKVYLLEQTLPSCAYYCTGPSTPGCP